MSGVRVLEAMVEAAWGGYERPPDDAGILRAIADWMDRLDDVPDGIAERPIVSRTMQDDLRRIADSLDPARPTPTGAARDG